MIGAGCQIANTIIMGADFDETPGDIERNASQGIPNIGIGAITTIDGAIVDKNACIGDQVNITNRAGVKEAEGANYYIRDGIVVEAKDAVIPSGTVILRVEVYRKATEGDGL